MLFNKAARVRGIFAVAIVALIGGSATTVLAGYKPVGTSVYVDTAWQYAYGDLGFARNSADSMQYIGCSVEGSTGYKDAYCYARDAAGNSAFCWTKDAAIVAVIMSLADSGDLSFYWQGSTCTNVGTGKYSYHEPKR